MKSKLLYATVIVALLAVTISAVGQQPAQEYVSVSRVQVKADRVAEFVEIAKQRIEPIKKAAPAGYILITCRTRVGNGNEFWRFTVFNKFADWDGEDPANKFFTPQERATRNARMAQTIERSQGWVESVIGDLLVERSGSNGLPKFLRYNRIRVRPGTANDFINNYKTDILPVVKKLNRDLRVHQIRYGGNQNEFSIYGGFDKWAELDDNTSFVNAIGGQAAAQKLSDKMNALQVNSERYVLEVLPDLSYVPAPAATPKR